MNERIQELARRVVGKRKDDVASISLFDEQIEQFAELLIREYEQFLPEICPWSKADEKGPMKGWHVQFVARKHFGIE
jgi:hypothetical protein